MKIEFNKTNRGFHKGTFTDRYGEPCSIQKSSLASEDAIWLGIENANPQIMQSDAVRLGLSQEPNPVGWMPFPVPKEVVMSTRMHLTQEQVKELIPILQKFVDTGEIFTEEKEQKEYTKVVKCRGKEYKQKVEALDCIFCEYNTGCDAWGCVSGGCELTKECFACNPTGTWCPFGEIPEYNKFMIEIVKELEKIRKNMDYREAHILAEQQIIPLIHERFERTFPDTFVKCTTKDGDVYKSANGCMYSWYIAIISAASRFNFSPKYQQTREEMIASNWQCIERFYEDLQATQDFPRFIIENVMIA